MPGTVKRALASQQGCKMREEIRKLWNAIRYTFLDSVPVCLAGNHRHSERKIEKIFSCKV